MSEKNLISNSLSFWIGIKALIDTQSKEEDFAQKNFEDFLFENAELIVLNEVANSYFLWQRTFNYFSCKQREIIRDTFCKENSDV